MILRESHGPHFPTTRRDVLKAGTGLAVLGLGGLAARPARAAREKGFTRRQSRRAVSPGTPASSALTYEKVSDEWKIAVLSFNVLPNK
jgi:hypothetical protein